MFTQVERPLHGADRWEVLDRFVGDPGRWLPLPAHPCRDGRWRIGVDGAILHRLVDVWIGPVSTHPDAWVREVRWCPEVERHLLPAAALPDLVGRVVVRERDDGLWLEVCGHYRPPLGLVGAVADGLALHRIARSTLERLADEVAANLAPPVRSPV